MQISWLDKISSHLARDLQNISAVSEDLVLPPTTSERNCINSVVFDFRANSILDFSKTYHDFNFFLNNTEKTSILTAYVLCDSRYSIFSDLKPKRVSIRDPASMLSMVGCHIPCRAHFPTKNIRATTQARRIFIKFLMGDQGSPNEYPCKQNLRVSILSMIYTDISEVLVYLLTTGQYTDDFADSLYVGGPKIEKLRENITSNLLYSTKLFEFCLSGIGLGIIDKGGLMEVNKILSSHDLAFTANISTTAENYLQTDFTSISNCSLVKLTNPETKGVEFTIVIPRNSMLFYEEDWLTVFGLLFSLVCTGRFLYTDTFIKLPEKIKKVLCYTTLLHETALSRFFIDNVEKPSQPNDLFTFVMMHGFFLNNVRGPPNCIRSDTLSDGALYNLDIRARANILSAEFFLTLEDGNPILTYKNVTIYEKNGGGSQNNLLAVGNLSKRNGTTKKKIILKLGATNWLLADNISVCLFSKILPDKKNTKINIVEDDV